MPVGTPLRFALPVCAWLDNHFPDLWIERRGPSEWPARDSFLWGWAKEEVYRWKPRTLEREQKIRDILLFTS
jgi:hypothetical protein